jgi:hypothetical protein
MHLLVFSVSPARWRGRTHTVVQRWQQMDRVTFDLHIFAVIDRLFCGLKLAVGVVVIVAAQITIIVDEVQIERFVCDGLAVVVFTIDIDLGRWLVHGRHVHFRSYFE